MALELKYPENLMSAGLYKTTIKNLNACTNLTCLHSNQNTYYTENIANLTTLKRFVSTQDEFKSNNNKTMLFELLRKNPLEVVVINNGKNVMAR